MNFHQGKKNYGKKMWHLCPDWDYMEIDIDMPEFEACRCFVDKRKRQAFISGRFSQPEQDPSQDSQ